VGGDVSVDSETLLVANFVNLKIKPTQYFRVAHKVRGCMRVFIEVDMSIYVLYYIFFKKKYPLFALLFNNIMTGAHILHHLQG
jgi:hypothetical protein